MGRTFVVIVAAIVTVGGALVASSCADQSDRVRSLVEADLDESCVVLDENGGALFAGSPSPGLRDASEVLAAFADANSEFVLGTSYCSDYSGFVVYASSQHETLSQTIDQARRLLETGETIGVEYRAVSLDEALDAMADISNLSTAEMDIRTLGPDLIGGGIEVTVGSEAGREALLASESIAEIRSDVPMRIIVSDVVSVTVLDD